jgi:metal-responsive CopG/Arc/MetJ family transcriptional regulator
MLYIMRRTQLYLHEDLWKRLHLRSKQRGTSISELVREAVREKYGNSEADRKSAMRALVGLWKDRKDLPDTEAYVRRLRRGRRLQRIAS